MGPTVEVGSVGVVDEDINFLAELPEGDYIVTEFEAMLDPALLDDYQLI